MLSAAVIALAGGIALAQQGMGHSNMGSMGMVDHGVMIRPNWPKTRPFRPMGQP